MRGRPAGRLDNQDGLAALEPRPGERQGDGRLATLRRRPQHHNPPAAPGHVEHLALPRETAPRVAASRPGRDEQRAIRPRAVGFARFRRVLGRAPGERDRGRAALLGTEPARPIRALFPAFCQRYHAVTTGP